MMVAHREVQYWVLSDRVLILRRLMPSITYLSVAVTYQSCAVLAPTHLMGPTSHLRFSFRNSLGIFVEKD